MTKGAIALIIVAVTGLLFIHFCIYTVAEHELVVEREFQKVVGEPVTEPGLKIKLPWIEALKFDARWLAWEGDRGQSENPNQITTRDKRYIHIDVFARWRIKDPLVFVEKLGDEASAQGRLDDILDSATRNVIANHNLIESIRSSNRDFAESDEELQNTNMLTDDAPADTQPESAGTAQSPVDAPPDDDEEGEADPPSDAKNAVDRETDTAAPASDDDSSDTDSSSATDSDSASLIPQALAEAAVSLDSKDIPTQTNDVIPIKLGRQKLTELILEKATDKAEELGIELKDVRIKRIEYIPSVQESVFERMISERQKVAALLRSQGDGLAALILGRMDRELKRIRSGAYRTAEEIKGDADAQAARIYAEAYENDPELYRFLKTLETYRTTIDNKTWLIMSTESDWGTYLQSQQ